MYNAHKKKHTELDIWRKSQSVPNRPEDLKRALISKKIG